MNTCEHHELSLSTLIDGELDPTEIVVTIDHLSACEACREFYRDAREVDRIALTAVATDEPSLDLLDLDDDELWERIESRTTRETPIAQPRASYRPIWMSAAAAVLAVLAIGLAFMMGQRTTIDTIEVVLGQDRGMMSDDRFVELTTELLGADRRYHEKMLEVMQLVSEQGDEGSSEDRLNGIDPDDRRRDLDNTDGGEAPQQRGPSA